MVKRWPEGAKNRRKYVKKNAWCGKIDQVKSKIWKTHRDSQLQGELGIGQTQVLSAYVGKNHNSQDN